MTSRQVLCLLLLAASGCSKSKSSEAQASTSAAPNKSAAPMTSAAPAPTPAPEQLPRALVNADGITLTETASGTVVVKTTTLWNAPLETTYENCDYYVRAIPVMERQVDPKRAAHFKEVCKDHEVKPTKPTKGVKSTKP
jgi:hypothetical protein